jgi:hypothetical protein
VANDADVNVSPRIIDRVDDSVVADSNAPQIVGAFQFPAASGPWITSKSLDATEHPPLKRSAERLELLPCASGECDFVWQH